jgi:hypothetical protein
VFLTGHFERNGVINKGDLPNGWFIDVISAVNSHPVDRPIKSPHGSSQGNSLLHLHSSFRSGCDKDLAENLMHIIKFKGSNNYLPAWH